jgi:hypothetical protein
LGDGSVVAFITIFQFGDHSISTLDGVILTQLELRFPPVDGDTDANDSIEHFLDRWIAAREWPADRFRFEPSRESLEGIEEFFSIIDDRKYSVRMDDRVVPCGDGAGRLVPSSRDVRVWSMKDGQGAVAGRLPMGVWPGEMTLEEQLTIDFSQ